MSVITTGKKVDFAVLEKQITQSRAFKQMVGIAAEVLRYQLIYLQFGRTASSRKSSPTAKIEHFYEYNLGFYSVELSKNTKNMLKEKIKDKNSGLFFVRYPSGNGIRTVISTIKGIEKDAFDELTIGKQKELDATISIKFRDLIVKKGLAARIEYIFPHNRIKGNEPVDNMFVYLRNKDLEKILRKTN